MTVKKKNKDNKALTIPGPKSVMEIRKELGIELETDQIDIVFPEIKIIHQGQIFEMPEGTKEESFSGIILDLYKINAWWQEPFDVTGGGTPPDCFSMDGRSADSNSPILQNAECASCPLNQFGTDEGGRGKACKNMLRLHIIFQDELIPTRLTVPPSNLKPVNQYITTLAKKAYAYIMAETEFSLKEVKNKDGVAYSQLVLKVKIGEKDQPHYITDKPTLEGIMAMKKQWLNEMREAEILAAEYHDPGDDNQE